MLHLICGLPGAGKSTRALALERSGAGVRLTPDEWLLALGLHLYDPAARARVEALQWRLALQLLAAGTDVILENGFWTRAERDRYRAEAAALGASTRLHHLDAPLPVLRERIAARNRTLPAAERVDPADLDIWAAQFEPPDRDEVG